MYKTFKKKIMVILLYYEKRFAGKYEIKLLTYSLGKCSYLEVFELRHLFIFRSYIL